MRHLRVALLLALGLVFSVVQDLTPRVAYASSLPTPMSLTFTSGGTANSSTYTPQRPHMGVVVYVKATQAGTFQVQRLDSAGNWNNLTAAVAVAADTEDQHVFDFPIAGQLRVQYINTSAASGTALVAFIDKVAI